VLPAYLARARPPARLRVADVDFMRGVFHPAVQYPAAELKTEISRTPVPVPRSLMLELAAHVKRWPGETVLTGRDGGQLPRGRWSAPSARPGARWTACRKASGTTDLRHYFASLLIASGTDVKTMQARLRHASAKTTLDTYGHLWPDRDESTRAAVDAVLVSRVANPADSVRTSGQARRSRRRSDGR
jgi:integrase